jgi:hypothetical protein
MNRSELSWINIQKYFNKLISAELKIMDENSIIPDAGVFVLLSEISKIKGQKKS